MQYGADVEEWVGVVGRPEALVDVPPGVLHGEDVDGGHVEQQQDASEACDGLPAPVVELGQHVRPAADTGTRLCDGVLPHGLDTGRCSVMVSYLTDWTLLCDGVLPHGLDAAL